MKKVSRLRSLRQVFPILLTGVFGCLPFQTHANENSKGDSAPDVITTITSEEQQQIDRVRPKFVQPTAVTGDPAPTVLPLQPVEGETIAFLGNTLAARMEHYNYFETCLQQQFSKQKLTFRNMGYPGHTPAFRPESSRYDPWAFPGAKKFRPEIKAHLGQGHYPSPDEWLTIIQANTIVAFFWI